MKKLIGLLVLFLGVKAHCGIGVAEAPVAYFGTASVVSLTSSTWTQVPTTSTLARRIGIKVSNPSTNSYNIGCVLDSAAPAVAITVMPIEIQPGENPTIPIRGDVLLFCVSLTAAQSATVQEVAQ